VCLQVLAALAGPSTMRNTFYMRFKLDEPQPNSGLVGHLHGLLGLETYGKARVHINGIGSGDRIPIELGLSICADKKDEADFLRAVDMVLRALQSTVQHYNSTIPMAGGHQIWSVAGAVGDIHPIINQMLQEMEAEQKLPPTRKGDPAAFFSRTENKYT